MPSDAAKKRQQQKREKKLAQDKKRIAEQQQSKGKTEPVSVSNGLHKENDKGAVNGKVTPPPTSKHGATASASYVGAQMKDLSIVSASSCTGVLASHPDSRDIHIESLSVTLHGAELLRDAKLELNCGRRYGLVGLNGSGKSTLLTALGVRDLPIPQRLDIYHLNEEIQSSDKTPLQCVVEVDEERMRLEDELDQITQSGDTENERMMDIYERLDELDASTAETKAARILHGLGFTHEMQIRKCSDFSGGWRMRVSLARALFVKPHLLLLDEPTNHLDLEACVWLEEELKRYKRCLVLISHSQDFLNGVCTNIIHLFKNQLFYYGGNYDAYIQTKSELEQHQMKRYNWETEQIAHMKEYIARFGRGSNHKQAQSKEKVLAKMVAGGLAEKVVQERVVGFSFPDCGKLPPPVIMVQMVSFRYEKKKPLVYDRIDFGMDLETRVALVGPNGAGKSTLLKLIDGDLDPTDGIIRRHAHLKTGRYHQHLKDHLDLDQSAMEYIMKCYPEEKDEEQLRRSLGRYGLTGKQQICPMRNLSDGQKCRVTFAWLAFRRPHMLLLDEPTNHLDMETIDALADAINSFDGGMVLVSHDFRLISQVAQEIWVCENATVRKWPGDIQSYKDALKKKVKYKP